MQSICITGGTGYIGSRLIAALQKLPYRIFAVVRPGSQNKLPANVEIVIVDIFNTTEWISQIPEGSIFIHLIGVSHPSPRKKKLFDTIDLQAVKKVADAAFINKARMFIYLSVAMEPSSIMRDFQDAKAAGENYILKLGLPHIFIRPWYVLGPGHWWPYLLFPLYKLLLIVPATKKKAKAFSFVTIHEMIDCMVYVIQHFDSIPEVVEVEDIITQSAKLKTQNLQSSEF